MCEVHFPRGNRHCLFTIGPCLLQCRVWRSTTASPSNASPTSIVNRTGAVIVSCNVADSWNYARLWNEKGWLGYDRVLHGKKAQCREKKKKTWKSPGSEHTALDSHSRSEAPRFINSANPHLQETLPRDEVKLKRAVIDLSFLCLTLDLAVVDQMNSFSSKWLDRGWWWWGLFEGEEDWWRIEIKLNMVAQLHLLSLILFSSSGSQTPTLIKRLVTLALPLLYGVRVLD